MLVELAIENIALIDKLRLSLGRGLNVLTGETGAGKSILLDAMALILGAKADNDLIRFGAEKAIVEAVFTDIPIAVKNRMAAYGIEGEELILSRELSQGRSSCRINGRSYPLNVLREISERLVNIYGQHDFQNLAKADNHQQLLDSFIQEINPLKTQLTKIAKEITLLSSQIEDMNRKKEETANERELLEFQATEIDNADLILGEEDELFAKQKFLANGEKIINALSLAYDLIYGAQQNNVSELMGQASKNMALIADCAEDIQRFCDTIYDISAQNDDLALEIKSYLDGIEYSPNELAQIDERLYLIKNLKKKYGATIADILEYRQEINNRLLLLENFQENQSQSKQKLVELKTNYDSVATSLSELRHKAAQKLKIQVMEVLAELNMPADFETRFSPLIGFTSQGRENGEFYIRTNVGDDFKPLVKIASGGELARLMLALRSVLNTDDPVPTLVFDEVDAGMGGVTLNKVAEKIGSLAKNTQIFCVTHSAQIAVKAKYHYYVAKKEDEGQTFTQIKILDKEERIREIARMLDGQVSNASITHAADLLNNVFV